MSDVKQTIQVTNAGLSPILSIAQGTGMVDFEFTVSDFLIPAGSTAVAWNIQPTGNIVSQVCTLVGNVITVTPPAYYFLRGKNYMQIQVTGADGVNLFTFLIEVWCAPNISAPVVSHNPDLITQLMAMIGNMQDLDTTAKNNLVAAINEIYARGVVDILDTEEEIEANTDAGKATGALVTKQLISELSANGNKFYFDYQNGEYGYNTDPERGADTFRPFSGSDFQIILTLSTGMADAELISIRKNGIEFILDKIPFLNQNAPYGYIQVVYANQQWTIRNISGAVLTLKDLNNSTQTEFAQNEEKTWSYVEEKFFVLTE